MAQPFFITSFSINGKNAISSPSCEIFTTIVFNVTSTLKFINDTNFFKDAIFKMKSI